MFYCREKELGDMNKRYTRSGFECLVVYGRRRVGKTALINEFCKDKPTVFFSALNATSQENLEALSKAIYEKEHPGAETAPVYPSFDAAFAEITRMAETERLVFVIDEYPYLARANKSIFFSLTAYYRPYLDKRQSVSYSLRLFHELYGVSGAWL